MLALKIKCNEKFNSVTNGWLKYSWFGAKVYWNVLNVIVNYYESAY
ncbi:hypothetical protein PESP_a0014 [Pseudoalteromonas espejiana DSM 9414]|uniref:Uncharacterized protein n=1 Tax=Pseudoalteromonas espejiana TaxID=28107 RepID=A0A510XYB4_9GAMM|nr:hypothetical protein PESP_a0014 [Pseudoalteromonas espejiana DSM 9414]GEK56043.1 hypothetical protein PES01_28880 [Pseudoalteromonas espejiana]